MFKKGTKSCCLGAQRPSFFPQKPSHDRLTNLTQDRADTTSTASFVTFMVCASPTPSQGVDQVPSSTPQGGKLPYLSTQSPCCCPLPTYMEGPGIEKWTLSRRARHLPPSRRSEPRDLRIAPNGTCLLTVRSFPVKCTKCYSQTLRETNSLKTMWIVEFYYTGGSEAEFPF